MDYSKSVPSRELCEEMAELRICNDDEPELVWVFDDYMDGDGHAKNIWILETFEDVEQEGVLIHAPTLARMMEELPHRKHEIVIGRNSSDEWWIGVDDICAQKDLFHDKHLPNAVAKALIAIKKDGQS